ncbi:MAG: hypothetical protein QG588_784 [Candidatus Poribacteria bacterium]|nr:hypothetical protein [Candidatus Poribacteria bacterium]
MKVKITQRVIDDRNVIVVDPLEMLGTVDFKKYIEAYDPDKPIKDCVPCMDAVTNLGRWLGEKIATSSADADMMNKAGYVKSADCDNSKARAFAEVKEYIENTFGRESCKPTEPDKPKVEQCNDIVDNYYVCQRPKGHKGNHEDYEHDSYWVNHKEHFASGKLPEKPKDKES